MSKATWALFGHRKKTSCFSIVLIEQDKKICRKIDRTRSLSLVTTEISTSKRTKIAILEKLTTLHTLFYFSLYEINYTCVHVLFRMKMCQFTRIEMTIIETCQISPPLQTCHQNEKKNLHRSRVQFSERLYRQSRVPNNGHPPETPQSSQHLMVMRRLIGWLLISPRGVSLSNSRGNFCSSLTWQWFHRPLSEENFGYFYHPDPTHSPLPCTIPTHSHRDNSHPLDCLWLPNLISVGFRCRTWVRAPVWWYRRASSDGLWQKFRREEGTKHRVFTPRNSVPKLVRNLHLYHRKLPHLNGIVTGIARAIIVTITLEIF